MSEINAEVITPDPVQAAKDKKEYEDRVKERAKAKVENPTAKQAVLDRLGITADEAALLFG
jgi:hypothetical protein